ncbi:RPP1 [[Candida] subhashii]|uniref:RPP1 n=1 Tax=[Candida] subhashii TaxID=561895 RepID=A0A8J5UU04_9ASCO|nr:RPP1 [[Candida] subhashii]KAG7661295.1 RPP1 [[Candida] subhashii]
MSYDLNIPWPVDNYNQKPTPQQLTNLKNTIITSYSLGITHQVINFSILETVKIPLNQPQDINPIDITYLTAELSPQFKNLKLFTRLTLIINDSSKLTGLTKLQNHFDLIAIQPLNEKALQLTITNLDIDLISLNLASRLPFFLKHKIIGSGIEKGIKFEICYSSLVSGSIGYANVGNETNVNLIKKNFFSNVLQLVRATRSRGIVVSSGATQPLQIRNSNDILVLLKTLGLDRSRAKSCISVNPERVLVNGRLRVKSYKQTISVGNEESSLLDNVHENPNKKQDGSGYKKKLSDSSSGRLLKKRKIDTNEK